MALSIESLVRPRPARVSLRNPLFAAALIAACALFVPLTFAPHANLTSDESLYLAEAYNIAHGKGLTYPSGEAITHRAPLHPLVLAPAVRAGGPDAAHAVSKAIVIINAVLVAVFAWRLAGGVAAAVAGGVAAASSYLNGLGITLYLDPLQCTFMLAVLLALLEGVRRDQLRWFALAGALVGGAFLVKESAVQWAPLGLAVWLALPSQCRSAGLRSALAFTLTFAAVIAPWWAWVFLQSGDLFLLGEPHRSSIAFAVAGALTFTALLLVGHSARVRRAAARHSDAAGLLAIALIVVWGALLLYGLTRYSTWPYANDYAVTLPDYLATIAPAAQPFLLLVLSWPIVGLLAWRRNEGARLLIIAAALFMPFALFAANRGLQLRDALPIVYLSYVALGVAAAWLAALAREFVSEERTRVALAALCVAAAALFAVQQAVSFRADAQTSSSTGVRADSWDSGFVRESAGWMDANLPPGSRVLSSRLYFSSLHVLTEGRFEIRQLPTVRVDVDPEQRGIVRRASNLFRWGDDDPGGPPSDDSWIYLRQFYGKGYWVALSQQELLAYVDAHGLDYIVLTGEDVAFSSLQLALYLSRHPAFSLLHHEAVSVSDQLFVYAVDHDRLAPVRHDLALTPYDLATLEQQTRLTRQELAAGIGTPIRVTDLDYGISTAEQAAALEAQPGR